MSADYARLSDRTRQDYRMAIDRLLREEGIGHRLVKQLKREHVGRMMAKRAGRPGAANWVLKIVRLLVRFSIGMEMRQDDPTRTLKRFSLGEHRSWTDDEIATFEAHWPVGTKERTAFALFLYTGQRLSDVRRMSWRDLDGNGINVRQQKTGKPLWVPLHPNLTAAIAQWPRTHMAILTTNYGKAYT